MKHLLLVLALALPSLSHAQAAKAPAPAPTLKSILLEQLKTTHNKADWFVPANTAVKGLTPEQASWTDGKGNHSVGQLTNHLVFWNARQLATFKGETNPKFDGNNDETFNKFDNKNWPATVQRLDDVMAEMEALVEKATDKQLAEWAPAIAHVSTHNAYHIGQIVYVRKLQGSWNPKEGVQ